MYRFLFKKFLFVYSQFYFEGTKLTDDHRMEKVAYMKLTNI